MDPLLKQLMSHHSPGKRYSYYPPVSTWSETSFDSIAYQSSRPWSLYIHLPFCNQLCTFCGCNIKVSSNEAEHIRYIDAIIAEYRNLKLTAPNGPFTLIFGGGSPNVLHSNALKKLVKFIKEHFLTPVDSLCEIDPRSFNETQLDYFEAMGIRRYSFGVQDFDSHVVNNVNRAQGHEELIKTASLLRHAGASFGIDLLWGMPLQENNPFKDWKAGLESLRPDWINYYPMASVPSLASIQNAYGDFVLPSQERKYELYIEGSKIFEDQGYISIGMGHFLHESSKLYKSFLEKDLYRSVSGLFFNKQEQVLGLGVSAISTSETHSWQNQKIIDRYMLAVEKRGSAVFKAHPHNEKDRLMTKMIEDVFLERFSPSKTKAFPANWFKEDKMNKTIKISKSGRHFKKNILQALENDLNEKELYT